jgi:thymidine phosphorylase
MDTPLGRASGNGLEVTESLEVLRGGGPADVIEVTLALAREMLALAGVDADPAAALADGRALATYEAMVRAQGGDPDARIALAAHRRTVDAPRAGWLRRLDCRAVGIAAWRLGAGRARKEDPVSPTAGIVCLVKPGERIDAGQPVLELHADDTSRFHAALAALEGAIDVGDAAPDPRPLVVDRIA